MDELTTLRRDFDEMLDRLEAAARDGHTKEYGFLENQADVALAKRFVDTMWAALTNQEQTAYQRRLAYLKGAAARKPRIIT